MPTLGPTGKPGTAQELWGLNTKNQTMSPLTMPAGGPWKITRVGFWAAGNGSAVNGYGCIWGSGGDFKARTGAQSIPSAGFALGAGYEMEAALTAPYVVDGGEVIYVGFSRNPAEGVHFPTDSTGSHVDHTKTGSYPGDFSGSSHAGVGRLGAWITYEAANSLPNKPSLNSPADGITTTDLTPTLKFTHNDPDGDSIVKYDLQVADDDDFDAVDLVWDVTQGTAGITGDVVERTYNGDPLDRGVTYYWRARTYDAEGFGAWSNTRSFKINALPTVTKASPLPAGGQPCVIHNLGTDLAAWTDGGAHAKPKFDWLYGTGGDGDSQTAYRVRVYSAASGGSLLHDSGVVVSSVTNYLSAWAGVRNTQYWWTVEVRDALNEWSGESSRTSFYIRWAQAIYQHNTGLGSSSWGFSAGAIVAGAVAFLYATATGADGAGRSAWKTSIGALSPAAASYLNVLVRIRPSASSGVSASPQLPSMTFTYLGTSVMPDKWSTQATNPSDWGVDNDVRRFGSRAMRCIVTATAGLRYLYPYENAVGSDVSVTPNTEYVLSCYVNTGELAINAPVRLAVMAEGSVTDELVDTYLDSANAQTSDSAEHPEGWQRLSLHFRTAEQTRVRPMLRYGDSGTPTVGDTFWVDAVQQEESVLATGWRPGMVGSAAVLDVNGLVIDGLAGGIFRLRDVAGRTAELDSVLDAVMPSTFRWERVTSGFNIPDNVVTLLNFNTSSGSDELDDISVNTPVDDQLTINRAGWYQLACGISWAPNALGRRELFLRVNGVIVVGSQSPAPAGFTSIDFRQACSTYVYLAAGDVVYVDVRQTSGAGVQANAAPATFLSVQRVRS